MKLHSNICFLSRIICLFYCLYILIKQSSLALQLSSIERELMTKNPAVKYSNVFKSSHNK